MTAKRVRRVKADTDKVLKCISELGRLNYSRSSRELPIQSAGMRHDQVPHELSMET